jgi:hypothetical protein
VIRNETAVPFVGDDPAPRHNDLAPDEDGVDDRTGFGLGPESVEGAAPAIEGLFRRGSGVDERRFMKEDGRSDGSFFGMDRSSRAILDREDQSVNRSRPRGWTMSASQSPTWPGRRATSSPPARGTPAFLPFTAVYLNQGRRARSFECAGDARRRPRCRPPRRGQPAPPPPGVGGLVHARLAPQAERSSPGR